ncbi:hypothetical protein QE152_g21925 [Popillia japonica]|uniref:Uncharacterized protein n=1 Tax=Popillia japonica TaxID=7064 RepID=A0AAW1KK89_POPJA
MVFNTLWLNTWIIPGISVGVLICVVMFIIMCTCTRTRSDDSLCKLHLFNATVDQNEQFSNSLKQDNEYGFFRRLSVLSTNTFKISNSTLKSCKSSNFINIKERTTSENELLDSFSESNSFEYGILKVDDTEVDDCNIDMMSEETDDTLSCLSNDSKFTAYSTFTLTRGSSFAETVKSALSYTDINKF